MMSMRNFTNGDVLFVLAFLGSGAFIACSSDDDGGSEAEAEAESESESEGEGDCGNGVIDGDEQCDGEKTNGETCDSLGLENAEGDLALLCDEDCTLDTTVCGGPDLIVYQAGLIENSYVEKDREPRSCEIALGCVGGESNRTVFNFDLISENIGNQDLVFGDPENVQAPYTDLWQYNKACGITQFDGYARYWLCPAAEKDCSSPKAAHVAEGRKASFCFIENYLQAPDWTGEPNADCGATYNCNFMGQQPGCADSYSVGLDCQFIDVTDVEPGDYTLCAHIDPDNLIRELRDDNNIACVDISL